MKKIKVNPPLYEAEPVSSVKELLNNASAKCGDRIAFSYKEKDKIVNVTYSQFLADTIALGTALHKIGVCGSHIACIGENSYKWITVYLTVLKSSGVFVPIDKELPTDDIINIVNSSDSEVLFYSAKYEKQIFDSQDRFKNVKYFIGFDRETDEGNNLGYDEFKENGMYLYADGYDEYLNEQFSPDDLKMLVYTSGTTGMAKGVMLSERNLLSCVYYGLQVSKVYDRCLSVLPYSHTYESVAGILVSLHHHSTICINDNLKNLLRNMQTFKPDYIYVVPAFAELFYKKIWASAEQSGKASLLRKTIKLADTLKLGKNARRKMFSSIHEAFGGNLKKIVCGGAPIRAELGDFFESVGITLVNGYGITECSPLVSVNRDDFNDCSTVGIPLPCCEIKFDNQGEISVKGDIVMLGYYKNPELTAAVMQNGWFKTGDCGYLNEQGQLIINGRKKNLIVLGNGKNIFPEELEGYIQSIPYVKEVIVYGICDKSGLENGLGAELFLSQEALKELNITDAYSALRCDIDKLTAALPRYKHINEIRIRDTEFPKTTTNKIKRDSANLNF